MSVIKTPEELPDWFDIEKYAFKPANDDKLKQAVLAVLDRMPYYQLLSSCSLTGLDKDTRDAVFEALEDWAAEPYKRLDGERLEAFQALECPMLAPPRMEDGSDASDWFTGLLDREEQDRRRELETLLEDALARLAGESPESPEAIRDELRKALTPTEGEKHNADLSPIREGERRVFVEVHGSTGSHLRSILDEQWLRKLFIYYAAAYMDLAIWAALEGETLNIRSLHDNFRKDYAHGDIRAPIETNQVSVSDFMKLLTNMPPYALAARLEDEGVLQRLLKNLQPERKS